jgi:ribonuclease P protein component
MKKYITLKDNRDFSRLYKKGKSFVSPVLVTYVLKNKSDNLRFGITTGKKIGKAVKRTRARRVIRAAYYELYPNLKSGYDIVFVARGKTPFVKSQVVLKSMKKQLALAGLFEPNRVEDEKNFNSID